MSRHALVLDASSVLCLLFREGGAERVEAVIDRAALSCVNYAEVLGTLLDRGVDPKRAMDGLEKLGVAVVRRCGRI